MAGWQGVVSGGESARDSARGRTRASGYNRTMGGPGGAGRELEVVRSKTVVKEESLPST